ncbi:host specificity factor TipJ family phage tail protein [Rubellimicrobium sp. CFH 75288]|uniref:host specificity factor TipJ family phage tail protein n=1 Tax=Rubellimicrobium sp. CFH 75288 TaxID=2697034 RepID=UPI001413532C|nr:host specificity factor TipJ family phage tail protein [Rubellimicrobium sp. CFH 75288]NAZ37137.1 hypothetical protein [Rubellimicrobium sp. CFH 75288]
MNALAPLPVPVRTVAVRPHPFQAEPVRVTVGEGLTVEQIVAAAGLRPDFFPFVRVWINDAEIDRRYWAQVRPKPGRQVYVAVVPQGGDGGVLRSVLMLVVSVAASAFAPGIAGALFPATMKAGGLMASLATAAVGAGISLLGALAVSALVPPPPQDTFPGQRAFQASVRNRFEPYAFIPQTFGRRRIYPLLAARPFTEASGDKRWLRVLLCVGWGPLAISDIRIGDTPITSFPNIKVEVREGWRAGHAQFGTIPSGKLPEAPHKLFTQSVREETFNTLLAHNVWHQRTTQPDTTEISVDVTAPFGLMEIEGDGGRKERTIDVDVQYRKVGTTTWINAAWDGQDEEDGTDQNGRIRLKAKSATPVIRGGRWELPEAGQWEVRLRRTTSPGSERNAERVEWTALRSITSQYPVAVPGLATIALLIKATDEFNGLPDTINCVAESWLPVRVGSGWSWQLSRNPAWAYADALRRQGTKRRIPDARIDIPAIEEWAAACAATAPNAPEPRWRFDATLDTGSLFEALRLIAAHGRASYAMRDGLHSVVRDTIQPTPVQHITPRNSWGYSGTKRFIDRPHALKVQFVNAENGWREDETIVYDDGYSAANADRFEILDLPGCTSQTQAWREGRYHLAVGKLRPEEHIVHQDVENLRCTKGDRVQFAHDVISVGVGSGRVVSRVASGGNVTSVTIDNAVPLQPGKSYAMRVRRSTGAIVLYTLQGIGAATQTDTLVLSPAVTTGGAPQVGDLVTVGEATRETMPMIVKAVEPGPDMSARLTLIAYHEGIHTAETSTIPPWSSYVNDDTPPDQQRPPQPVLTVVSNEAALERLADGTLIERIAVGISPFPATRRSIRRIVVQWRPSGTTEWIDAPGSPGRATRLTYMIAPVKVGEAYDIRARLVGRNGLASPWAVVLGHVVVGRTTPPAPVADFTAEPVIGGVRLRWSANPEIDVTGYQIRRGASWETGTIEVRRTAATERFIPMAGYAPATFWIKARDSLGLMSPDAMSVVGQARRAAQEDIDADFRPGRSATAPPQVTGVTATGGIRLIWLEWARSPAPDLSHYEIYEQATATPAPTAGTAATLSTAAEFAARASLGDAVTRHYWVRAVDTSGRRGAWSARVQATTAERAGVTTAAVQGLIDATSFAAGVRPVEIVSALPTSGNFAGRVVFLTTDAKLYRHTGSPAGTAGFTAVVPAADITGQITSTQISDSAITTPKLAANAVTANAIAANAVTAGKVAAAAIGTDQLAANAVRAGNLLLVDMENLAPEWAFEEGDAAPFLLAGAGQIGWSTSARTGSRAMVVTRTDTSQQVTVRSVNARLVAVREGETYWIEMEARSEDGESYSNAWQPRVAWFDASRVLISVTTLGTYALSSSWDLRTDRVVAPAGARFASPSLRLPPGAAPIRLDRAVLRRANAAQLIVDGSIQANHLSAGEIITLSAQIGTGIITRAKIADAAINAAKIADAEVTTLKIRGEAVTVARRAFGSGTPRDVSSTTDWLTLASVTIPRTAGFETDYAANLFFDGYGQGTIRAGIFRGGALLRAPSDVTGPSGRQASMTIMGTDSDRGAGNATYHLRVQRVTGSPVLRAWAGYLRVQQFKR